MRKIVLVALMVMALVGCPGGNNLKPSQVTTADPATTATLKDIQAQVVTLAQQNQTAITAIQKSQQDAQETKTQIGTLSGKMDSTNTKLGNLSDSIGGIGKVVGNVSQNQFRIESWLDESTDGWPLRACGVARYVRGDHGDNPDSPSGTVERKLDGVRSGLPDAGNSVPGGNDPGLGGTPADPQRSASAAIGKEVKHMAWYWIVILCLFSAIAGIQVKAVIEALDPQLDAAIQQGESGILVWLAKIVHELVGFFHKPGKTAAPPKT